MTSADDRASFRYRRFWLLALLGYFLVGAAWAIATPYDGAPDEADHVVRAYGVVTGQVVLKPEVAALGGGGFVDAPASLMVDRCWQTHLGQDVSCAGSPGADQSVQHIGTSAARNNPLFYAIVGAPIVAWPDWTGVILARLIGVLLSGLMLATALADAMKWSRHRLMAAGVFAVVTPMTVHLMGSVNPNAIELSAAVLLFSAAVPLMFLPEARRDNTLLWHFGVAAAALGFTRMLGPLWLGIAVLALLPWTRSGLAELWAWRRARWWALGLVVAATAGAAWTLLSSAAAPNPYFAEGWERYSTFKLIRIEFQNWFRYVQEMVGITSWLDARIPEISYVIWPIIGGALVLGGYLAANRHFRGRLVALTGAAIFAPMAISVALANTFGLITQGRYLLPLLSGVVLIATFLIGQSELGADRAATVRHLVLAAVLPIHLGALYLSMRRWGRGLGHGLNVFSAPWQPPLGSVLPILAVLAGLGLLGWLVWGMPPQHSGAHRLRDLAAPAQVGGRG